MPAAILKYQQERDAALRLGKGLTDGPSADV